MKNGEFFVRKSTEQVQVHGGKTGRAKRVNTYTIEVEEDPFTKATTISDGRRVIAYSDETVVQPHQSS